MPSRFSISTWLSTVPFSGPSVIDCDEAEKLKLNAVRLVTLSGVSELTQQLRAGKYGLHLLDKGLAGRRRQCKRVKQRRPPRNIFFGGIQGDLAVNSENVSSRLTEYRGSRRTKVLYAYRLA